MKNVKTFTSALVVLLGTSTLAFADANNIGFDMSGAASSATVTTRSVTQTGSGNEIDATVNGSINTVSFTQTGDDNAATVTLGGSSSSASSYALTAVGDGNIVNTTISAATGAFTYVLDILGGGSGNQVTETFSAAATSVDSDTNITGDFNITSLLVDALVIASDYVVSGLSNRLTVDADAGGLVNFTSNIDVDGDSNDITDTVNSLVTTLDNTLAVTGSANDLDLTQSAVTSKINATVNASYLTMDVIQSGTTSNILIAEVNAASGAGATYTVTQSAATSTFTDNLNLAAGGTSTVSISN